MTGVPIDDRSDPDDWGADWEPEEGAWEDEDAESLTVPCLECGTDVYEDAEQCPACGHWITHSETSTTSAMQGKPLWYVVLGLLGIIAVVLTLTGLAWL